MDSSLRDEIVTLTNELITFQSTADRPDQLKAVIDYAESYIARIPGVYLSRYEHSGKPVIVATLRETREPIVMLNAHLDVVAARPDQFEPVLRDGRIYGRGSQDMKGSGAVLLRLLKDLAALEQPPDVGFQFVSDEEIGGADGTRWLLEQGYRCRFFIAAEPTDMQICHESKAILWMQITLNGDPAHGSRPWDGRNAMLALRDGLVALERRFPTPTESVWRTTVTPTVIHGGTTTNRLPEQVTVQLDCRRLPSDDPDAILAAVRACFPGGATELLGSGPPLQTPPDDPFIAKLAAAARQETGNNPELYGEHYGTDARFYSDVGIPAICFGPVGKGLHSDEEWVSIDSLTELYAVLRRFVTEA